MFATKGEIRILSNGGEPLSSFGSETSTSEMTLTLPAPYEAFAAILLCLLQDRQQRSCHLHSDTTENTWAFSEFCLILSVQIP